MNPSDIDHLIRDANLDEVCDPRGGDCVSVAVAIKEEFGGMYICSYQTPVDLTPAHAAVEIDGVVFDGFGKTTREVLYDIAITGLSAENMFEMDEHIDTTAELKNNQNYDRELMKLVKERIRRNG